MASNSGKMESLTESTASWGSSMTPGRVDLSLERRTERLQSWRERVVVTQSFFPAKIVNWPVWIVMETFTTAA